MELKNEPAVCGNCGGSGTVIVYVDGKPQAVTCGVCGGSGLV